MQVISRRTIFAFGLIVHVFLASASASAEDREYTTIAIQANTAPVQITIGGSEALPGAGIGGAAVSAMAVPPVDIEVNAVRLWGDTTDWHGYWAGLPPKNSRAPNVDPYSMQNGWYAAPVNGDVIAVASFYYDPPPRDPPEDRGDEEPVSCLIPPANAPTCSTDEGGIGSEMQQTRGANSSSETDPVYLFSGEFVEEVTDLRVKGRGLDFIWSRKYRSKIAVDSAQGKSWDFSYDLYVTEDGDDRYVRMGTARNEKFESDSGSSPWYANGLPCRLTFESQQYKLEFASGIQWLFVPADDAQVNRRNKILYIIDRNGNSLDFNYDAQGRLSTIEDTLNTATNPRVITVSYYEAPHFAEGYIHTVTDFAGRAITYEYYDGVTGEGSLGDLKKVTYPVIENTPTGNDFAAGRSLEYTYSNDFTDSRLNHNLVSIKDGLGNTYVHSVYFGTDDPGSDDDLRFDRVTDQFWGDFGDTGSGLEGDVVSLTYYEVRDLSGNLVLFEDPEAPDAYKKTIVNDRLGNVSSYYFSNLNQLVLKRDFAGRAADPDSPTGHVLATWDPNGSTAIDINPPVSNNKVRESDPDYFDTQYMWSGEDFMLGLWEPSGQATVYIPQVQIDDTVDRLRWGNIREIYRIGGREAATIPGPQFTRHIIKEELDYGEFGSCGCGEDSVAEHRIYRGDLGVGTAEITFTLLAQTNYDYDSTTGNRTAIRRHPDITSLTTEIVETFEYNAYGQITEHTLPPDGAGSGHQRVDEFTYYDTGSQAGYLHQIITDTANDGDGADTDLALTYTLEYDAVGNLTRVMDPKGHDTQFVLNSNNELIRSLSRPMDDTAEHRLRKDYIYDANGNVVEVRTEEVDDLGAPVTGTLRTDTYEYETLNFLKKLVRDQGTGTLNLTVEFAHDANRNLVSVETPEANKTTNPQLDNIIEYVYDERDLVYEMVRSDTLTTQYDYDGAGNLITKSIGTEGTPQVYSYDYNGFGLLAEVTDPMLNVAYLDYDTMMNLTAIWVEGQLLDDATSNSSQLLFDASYEYDDMSRLTSASLGHFDENVQDVGDGQSTTTYQYADNSRLLSVTNDLSKSYTYAYDTVGRLSSVTDPKGNSVSYTYDANSNVTELTELAVSDLGPAQNLTFVTQYAYDNLDRLIEHAAQYTDSTGNPAENLTAFSRDVRGNVLQVTDATGNYVKYDYDAIDRLTTAEFWESGTPDALVAQVGQTFDANSRLLTRTDPLGKTTAYTHDAADNLTQIVFADGTDTDFTYDLFGNVTGITQPNATIFSNFQYDGLNRLRERVHSPGIKEIYFYDGLSRLKIANNQVASPTAPISEVQYEHDSLGNVTKESQYIAALTGYHDVVHTYNGLGDRLTTTYPGGRQLDYAYDDAGMLTGITEGGATVASYQYVGGQVARREFGNGTRTDYSYDGAQGINNAAGDEGVGQMVATLHSVITSGAVIDHRTYQWDALYNKTQRRDMRAGGPQLTHDYDYDALSRLTQSVKSFPGGGQVTTDYTFDAAGNRTGVQVSSDVYDVTRGYTLDAGADADMHQYTQTPLDARTYDLSGNTTGIGHGALTDRTLSYDAHGQLTGYTGTGQDSHGYLWDEDFSGGVSGMWDRLLGTWSAPSDVLEETSGETGRVASPAPFPYDRIRFSYRAGNPGTAYEPEYYAIALFDVDASAYPEHRYLALVIEPSGIYLRDWDADAVTDVASAAATSTADTWYDMEVHIDAEAGSVEVLRGPRGQALSSVIDVSGLTLTSGGLVGFGVGEGTEYDFDDFGLSPAGANDPATVTCKYDAFGRRVLKDGPAGKTYYFYDGAQCIQERNNADEVLAEYVYGPGIDEVLQMRRDTDGDEVYEDYYYHADDLSNVMALTDATGAVVERYAYADYGYPEFYDATGTPLAESAYGNPYLFTGRRWDPEMGLYYYRLRYLDPLAGRFITRDPLGLWGDPFNLGNPNAYVNNNPWTWTDPYGNQGTGATWFGNNQVAGHFKDLVTTTMQWFTGGRTSYNAETKTEGYDWPDGAGGIVGGSLETATLGAVQAESYPSWASAAGMDIGQYSLPFLGPGYSLIYNHTVSDAPVDRCAEAGFLALEFVPLVLEVRGARAVSKSAAIATDTGGRARTIRLPACANTLDDAARAGKARVVIDYPTEAGGYPSWTTVKRRYWGRNGAPTARARVRKPGGEIEEIVVSKELHHIGGRSGSNPHRMENLEESWPWEHAAKDPYRSTGYEFIEFVE